MRAIHWFRNDLRLTDNQALQRACEAERVRPDDTEQRTMFYAPDSDEMKKVYEYCAERGVPVLMHCNRGGFVTSDLTVAPAPGVLTIQRSRKAF